MATDSQSSMSSGRQNYFENVVLWGVQEKINRTNEKKIGKNRFAACYEIPYN